MSVVSMQWDDIYMTAGAVSNAFFPYSAVHFSFPWYYLRYYHNTMITPWLEFAIKIA